MGRPSSEKAVWRAAVDDLQEQLAHGDVDRVADKVGVERFQNGLARSGFRAAMAAEWVMPEQPMRLDQRFLDDAVFDVQGQLAGALLRRAPADAVRQAGDVFDLLWLEPICPLPGWARDRDGDPFRRTPFRSTSLEYCMCLPPCMKSNCIQSASSCAAFLIIAHNSSIRGFFSELFPRSGTAKVAVFSDLRHFFQFAAAFRLFETPKMPTDVSPSARSRPTKLRLRASSRQGVFHCTTRPKKLQREIFGVAKGRRFPSKAKKTDPRRRSLKKL